MIKLENQQENNNNILDNLKNISVSKKNIKNELDSVAKQNNELEDIKKYKDKTSDKIHKKLDELFKEISEWKLTEKPKNNNKVIEIKNISEENKIKTAEETPEVKIPETKEPEQKIVLDENKFVDFAKNEEENTYKTIENKTSWNIFENFTYTMWDILSDLYERENNSKKKFDINVNNFVELKKEMWKLWLIAILKNINNSVVPIDIYKDWEKKYELSINSNWYEIKNIS